MNKTSSFLLVLTAISLTTYWACGLQEARYVNYVEVPSADPGPDSQCEKEAFSLFVSAINPVLLSTCAVSGCHNATGTAIGGKNLSESDNAVNYSVIRSYTGTDPNLLFTKISSNGHGGGDRSSDLPLATITTWTDKENDCT